MINKLNNKVKRVWLKSNLKFFITIIILLFLGIFNINIVSAIEVQKFNPKETKHKIGLYRVENMKEPRVFHRSVDLEDGTILLTGTKHYFPAGAGDRKAEIFDSKTGKFQQIDMLYPHFHIGHKAILMDNGKVLVSCGLSQNGQSYEIFDPATKKFYAGPKTNLYCEENIFLEKNQNGKIIAYGKKLNNFSHDPATEEYDPKTNTITELPADYKNNIVNDADKLCENYKIDNLKENLHLLREKRGYAVCYADNKSVVIANGEIDYDISTDSIKDNKLYKTSWFSPLYFLDYEKVKLTPIYDYLRSSQPNIIKIKNRNMFLITGGFVPVHNLKKPYDSPEKIPLNQRILYTALYAVNYAYVFVY